jgi:hypothetical protein
MCSTWAGILLVLQRAAKKVSVNFGLARRTPLGRPSRRNPQRKRFAEDEAAAESNVETVMTVPSRTALATPRSAPLAPQRRRRGFS